MERPRSRSSFRDLELRLGHNYPPKDDYLGRNCRNRVPDVITIEDEDNDADDVESEDEVLVYSPRQMSASEGMPLFPLTSSWVPVVTEEDLELRLGHKVSNRANRRNHGERGESLRKTKFGLASSSKHRVSEAEGVKLKCTICMDTMKEETSTMCGHLFCRSCITYAIRIQHKCPACRNSLTMASIHRIYLPGATS